MQPRSTLPQSWARTGISTPSGFYRKHEFSANGGIDSRMSNPDGTLLASLTPAQRAAYVNLA